MLPQDTVRTRAAFGTSFPLLVFAVSVLFLLRKFLLAVWRWFRVWKALRPMPGPWDTVPFWFFASAIASRWKYVDGRNAFVEIFNFLRSTNEMYKGQNYKGYVGLLPVVVLQTPEAVEVLLTAHPKKPFLYSFFSDIFGPMNLVSANGAMWRQKRKILTPAFHFKILERFMTSFNEQADVLCGLLEDMADRNELVPIQRFSTRCAIDVITETAMGVRLGLQAKKDSVYANAIVRLTCSVAGRVFRPWYWSNTVYFSTPEGGQFKEDLHTLEAFGKKVLEERRSSFKYFQELTEIHPTDEKKSQGQRLAFLDILLDKHFRDKAFTLEQIRRDVDLFIAVGHETTAITLSWLIYLLALNPKAQLKLQEELDTVLGDDTDRDLTWDDLAQLKYLDCCIKETVRLYPPIPVLPRVLEEDMTIDGYVIPRGVVCLVNLFTYHRNEQFFASPEEFMPERFLTKEHATRHPYSYIPFSAGPRNCLGQRYAMTELKVLGAKLFRKLTFTPHTPLEDVRLTYEVTLRTRNKIIVQASRRTFPKEDKKSCERPFDVEPLMQGS